MKSVGTMYLYINNKINSTVSKYGSIISLYMRQANGIGIYK